MTNTLDNSESIRLSITKLKQLEENQLCYSYSEIPDFYKDNKPMYTKDFLWCHGANWNTLHEITKRYGYSNAVFKDNYRSAKNVEYLGNLLIYDYDDGVTIDEMSNIIHRTGLTALIATTQNHQKDKKGVICDRFRLIFQLNECIGSDISTNMMEDILQQVSKALQLPAYDPSCKTIERFYAPAPDQQHIYFDGDVADISTIILEAKKPKPMPTVRRTHNPAPYQNTGLTLKQMRDYVRDNITYDHTVYELEAKGLRIDRNGAIYNDKKHVGNLHPTTRMIAHWAESEHLDLIGVLDKFYNERYIENTKRLYEELI